MVLFYNVNDIGKSEVEHTFETSAPGLLCPAGSSTLLYVGNSTNPMEVCWLDCSTLPPEPADDREPIHLLQDSPLNDMCLANTDGKQYLVCAPKDGGVFAYMVTSNRFESQIKQIVDTSTPVKGITSDGRGHIFASDYRNSCVFMVTLEGTLMDKVLDLTDVGKPGTLCWCEKLSSLVVAYEKENKWAIVTVKLGKVF